MKMRRLKRSLIVLLISTILVGSAFAADGPGASYDLCHVAIELSGSREFGSPSSVIKAQADTLIWGADGDRPEMRITLMLDELVARAAN